MGAKKIGLDKFEADLIRACIELAKNGKLEKITIYRRHLGNLTSFIGHLTDEKWDNPDNGFVLIGNETLAILNDINAANTLEQTTNRLKSGGTYKGLLMPDWKKCFAELIELVGQWDTFKRNLNQDYGRLNSEQTKQSLLEHIEKIKETVQRSGEQPTLIDIQHLAKQNAKPYIHPPMIFAGHLQATDVTNFRKK